MDHLAEVATHSMVSCVSLDKSGICLPRESCGVEKDLRQVCLEHMRIRKHVNPNLQCKAAAFGPEIILGSGVLFESQCIDDAGSVQNLWFCGAGSS